MAGMSPDYAAELARVLRSVAEQVTGATHMNGEIVKFSTALRIAAS